MRQRETGSGRRQRFRLWKAALIAFVGGSAALMVSGAARADLEPAGSADDFVDRIGFCTHWGYTDTPYGLKYEHVKALLGEMGVRHVRDGWQMREVDLYSTLGIKTTLIFGPNTEPDQVVDLLKKHIDLVDMVEGPNEVDLFPTSANYHGVGFPEGPRRYEQALSTALKADPATAGLMLIAPSVGRPDADRKLAPLNCFDYLVMHSYAGGAMPSASLTADINNPMLTAYSLLGTPAKLKPFVVTESGYHTALGSNAVLAGAQPGVSEIAQAKYLPRHFCVYYNMGIQRTFAYEFIDEFPDYQTDERQATNAEACFGIIKRDLTPKPAYTALKNLIGLLTEQHWNIDRQRWERIFESAPYRFSRPEALDFTLTGDVKNVRHTLLQKANGDFYLVLWNEVSSFDRAKRADIVNPAAAVTLTLGTAVRTATLYQPGKGAAELKTVTNPHSLALSVPDEVLVVRLQPKPLSAPAGDAVVGVPSRLRAETAGSTIRLHWSHDSGPIPRAYAVYRMGALVGLTTTPEYRDDNLIPGAVYPYQVRAIDQNGWVSRPASIFAKTLNAFPDVIVTEVKLTPANPKPGDTVNFSATFKNIGTAPTPSGVVHGVAFFVDGTLVGWSDRFTGPLAPGASQTMIANNGPKGSSNFVWTPGPHKIRALFDDVNRLVESDKNNNDREITVP